MTHDWWAPALVWLSDGTIAAVLLQQHLWRRHMQREVDSLLEDTRWPITAIKGGTP